MSEQDLLIIDTDFGPVRVSQKTQDYMSFLDPDWQKIVTTKKKRSKHAQYVRQKWKAVESAACLLSQINYLAEMPFKSI